MSEKVSWKPKCVNLILYNVTNDCGVVALYERIGGRISTSCSGGYSNSGALGKDFEKLMFSKKEKEL